MIITDVAMDFITNYLGSIELFAVLIIVLFGALLLFIRIPPQYVLLILFPLVGGLASFAFGIPSWVTILFLIFIGTLLGIFVYSRVL